jgi:hypothetical protein
MKKTVMISISVMMIAIVMFFLYPMSLSSILEHQNQSMTVLVTGTNTQPIFTEQFEPGSEKYTQMQRLLEKYIYHPSLRTFIGDSTLGEGAAGFWVQISSGEHSLVSVGTGEVKVDDRIYRLGYWGNKAALSFMEEIRGLLEQSSAESDSVSSAP